MNSLKKIKSNFVNGSKPLPDNNQKIPDDWNDAKYVKQISTYSRKFLKEINDPNKKDESYLVGKPIYIENDMVFDDNPNLVQQSSPMNTQVNVVQRQYDTKEKTKLWHDFASQEFKQNYKDVSFNQNAS